MLASCSSDKAEPSAWPAIPECWKQNPCLFFVRLEQPCAAQVRVGLAHAWYAAEGLRVIFKSLARSITRYCSSVRHFVPSECRIGAGEIIKGFHSLAQRLYQPAPVVA